MEWNDKCGKQGKDLRKWFHVEYIFFPEVIHKVTDIWMKGYNKGNINKVLEVCEQDGTCRNEFELD